MRSPRKASALSVVGLVVLALGFLLWLLGHFGTAKHWKWIPLVSFALVFVGIVFIAVSTYLFRRLARDEEPSEPTQ
jgi:lipopolysaccharide export LptBFGC system permease protein LptF